MMSTHFEHPYHPPDSDLRIMEHFGCFVGEMVSRDLGVAARNELYRSPGEPVLPGSTGTGEGLQPSVSVPPQRADSKDRPVHRREPAEEAALQLASDTVNRLFSASLSLASARTLVGDGLPGQRIEAATDEIDRSIRDLRNFVFSLIVIADAASTSQNPRSR
jgi:hypothetical protein